MDDPTLMVTNKKDLKRDDENSHKIPKGLPEK